MTEPTNRARAIEMLAAALTKERGHFCSPDSLSCTTLCSTETIIFTIEKALADAQIVREATVEECAAIADRAQINPDRAEEPLSSEQEANLDGWNHCAESLAESIRALAIAPPGESDGA